MARTIKEVRNAVNEVIFEGDSVHGLSYDQFLNLVYNNAKNNVSNLEDVISEPSIIAIHGQ